MTLQLVEGFEDSLGYRVNNGTPVISASGRTGKCLEIDSTSDDAMIDLGALGQNVPSDTVTLGVAVRVSAYPSSGKYELIRIGNNTIPQMLQIMTEPGGIIDAGKYNQTVLGQTPAGVFTAGVWFYLEAQMRCHDTLGSFKLAVNGTTYVNVTNQDTLYTGNGVLDQIHFMAGMGSGTSRFDDLYVATGTGDSFFGDCIVDYLVPQGNGFLSQWAGNDGNSVDNYLLVDEIPASAADYVSSGVAGQQDLYVMSDLASLTSGTVRAVAPTWYASKDEVGPRQIMPIVRRTTIKGGTAQPLDFSPLQWQSIWLQDPETSAAWQQVNINGAQFGVELI